MSRLTKIPVKEGAVPDMVAATEKDEFKAFLKERRVLTIFYTWLLKKGR